MRKIQLSAFISVLPGAECGDGIPEGEKGEIVCSSAYVDGPTLDGVIGEAADALRDAVRDARRGKAPATPCDGPRPRMCPMGMSMMRIRAAMEPMNDLVYMFLSRALERFDTCVYFDVDWRAVSRMDGQALGVPDWLMEGVRFECYKEIGARPTFAERVDEFSRDRVAPFFHGLTPSRRIVLRLIAMAEFAYMLDALPTLDYGVGSEPLDSWCLEHHCPCPSARVFEDAGEDCFVCPRYSSLSFIDQNSRVVLADKSVVHTLIHGRVLGESRA